MQELYYYNLKKERGIIKVKNLIQRFVCSAFFESPLYLGKSGYGSNSKIFPVELLLLLANKHYLINRQCLNDCLVFILEGRNKRIKQNW